MSELRYISPDKLAEMVGEENVREMFASYLELLTLSLNQLKLCLEQTDLCSIRMIAHKIKSSTRMVGADELADDFAHLERLTRDDNSEVSDISTMFLHIQVSAGHVEQEITRYVSELG